MNPIIRYTGSPDSDVEDWLRINYLTHQPGPGSAYRVTIEPLESIGIRRALVAFLEAYKSADGVAMSIAATYARRALGTEASNA